jgi:hypothetical protein
MTQGDQRCFGCGGVREPGFLEDSGEHSKGYIRWIPGPLEKGLFGGARRWGRPRGDVNSYRCTLCGMLSLYVGGSPELTVRGRSMLSEPTPGQADPRTGHGWSRREPVDSANQTNQAHHADAPAPSPFTDRS